MPPTTSLQATIDALRTKWNIGPDFVAACDHPYSCRCDLCLGWWASVGADEENYGPFTPEEILVYIQTQLGIPD